MHTTGTNLDIDISLTQYCHLRLLYVSPVAKNQSIIANFSSGDIGRQNLMVSFAGSKVDSAFHPSEVDKMSTRNFWELSGKK